MQIKANVTFACKNITFDHLYFLELSLEFHDDKEKNAIFNHSLRHGVFNDIRNSPLKERLPADMQYYNPALEKRLFAKEFQKAPG